MDKGKSRKRGWLQNDQTANSDTSSSGSEDEGCDQDFAWQSKMSSWITKLPDEQTKEDAFGYNRGKNIRHMEMSHTKRPQTPHNLLMIGESYF
jgi:hypothetical protein